MNVLIKLNLNTFHVYQFGLIMLINEKLNVSLNFINQQNPPVKLTSAILTDGFGVWLDE